MKKLLTIIIIVLFFYFLATYFLNIFLPEKIRLSAQQFSEESLGRKLTVSQIKISILKGILLNDITLYEKDARTPYLAIKNARVLPLWSSIASSRKLFLSLRINGVSFALKRQNNNTLNLIEPAAPKFTAPVSAKSEQKENSGKKPLPLFFSVRDIYVKNFNLEFKDEIANFSKKFDSLAVFADLTALPNINFKLSWRDNLVLKGKYSLTTNGLELNAILKDIELTQFNPYLKDIVIKSGQLKEAKVEISGNKPYFLNANFLISGLEGACAGLEVKADIRAAAEVDLAQQNYSYHVSGSVSEGSLRYKPYAQDFVNLKTNFTLDNKKLAMADIETDFAPLQDKTGPGQKLKVRAKLEFDIGNSKLYIEANTASALNNFIKIVKMVGPDIAFLKNFSYDDKGEIELKTTLKADIKKSFYDYYIDYNLKGANFKDLRNIWLKGYVKKDKLKVEEGSFNYKNLALKGSLNIENFSSPAAALALTSDAVDIKLRTHTNEKVITMDDFSLKSKDSMMILKGTVNIEKEPQMKLQGLMYADLKDSLHLLKLIGIKVPVADKLNPQGALNAKFLLEGPLDPKQWQIKLAGLSDNLKIYNVEAKDVKIELYRDEKELIVSPLVATACGGKVEIRTKIDPSAHKATLNLIINDLDLATLRKQLELKNKKLSGILSLEANLTNNSLTKLDQLDGEGKIQIKEGNIWEINFLKGMGEFLFIPEFEEIKFDEGSSDLIFKDDNVVFENIELKSYQMGLKGKGRLSLNGDINFVLICEFNPELVSASGGLQKIITGFLGQTSLAIDLKGTVEKPTYKIKPAMFSDLEGFKKIIEGILR